MAVRIDGIEVEYVEKTYNKSLKNAIEQFKKEYPHTIIEYINDRKYLGQCKWCGEVIRKGDSYIHIINKDKNNELSCNKC